MSYGIFDIEKQLNMWKKTYDLCRTRESIYDHITQDCSTTKMWQMCFWFVSKSFNWTSLSVRKSSVSFVAIWKTCFTTKCLSKAIATPLIKWGFICRIICDGSRVFICGKWGNTRSWLINVSNGTCSFTESSITNSTHLEKKFNCFKNAYLKLTLCKMLIWYFCTKNWYKYVLNRDKPQRNTKT